MRTRRLALLLLPALLLAAPCGAQTSRTTTSRVGSVSTDGKVEYVWIDTGQGIEVRAGGELALRDGAPDVESIGPGGYLTVQQRVGSAVHRAEWRPAAGGGVSRSYTVGGARRDFAEARPWLDRFFPEVEQHTHVRVRSRFARVLAQRGVSGVLDEAAAAQSGATREVFLRGLAERDLSPAETQRFIQALGGISSSPTRRDLLKAVARQPLAAPQWSSWLAAASTVTSGSDRRELLLRLVAAYPRGRALPDGFFRSLDGIDLGSDRREVLMALLAARGSDPGILDAVLASTAKLTSSSDRREVLERAARLPAAAGAVPQYLRAAAGVGSSSDRREALAALLHNRAAVQASPAAVAWLGAVRQVPSESDRAELLMEAIGRLPGDRPTRAAFAQALETLSSNSSYNEVATAYLRSQAGRS